MKKTMKKTVNKNKITKTSDTQSSNSMRISVRISSVVTSLSIKKNLLALWVLLNGTDPNNIKDLITDFIYICLNNWKSNTAKGFSDFVTERLIQGMLEKDDFKEYREIREIMEIIGVK